VPGSEVNSSKVADASKRNTLELVGCILHWRAMLVERPEARGTAKPLHPIDKFRTQRPYR